MLTIRQNNSWLADGIVSFASRLAINGEVVIQEAKPIRALEIVLFDRGNLSNDVTFEIATLHASDSAALDFIARRRQTLGNLGDLVIMQDSDGYTATLASAGWRTTGARREGVSSIVQYSVRGGLFTTSSIGPIDFGLPTVTESLIDPLTIPSGVVGTIKSGEVQFAFSVVNNGQLILSPSAEFIMVAH